MKAVAIASLLTHANAWRPSFLPADIQDPLAYYYLNESTGWHLRDEVTANDTAGTCQTRR